MPSDYASQAFLEDQRNTSVTVGIHYHKLSPDLTVKQFHDRGESYVWVNLEFCSPSILFDSLDDVRNFALALVTKCNAIDGVDEIPQRERENQRIEEARQEARDIIDPYLEAKGRI